MSNQTPLVCICIPTYNAAGTILETLKSILAQTYPNLVVHISDNASTDDTVNIIKSLADSRVTIYRNDVNIGGEENFSRCIELATGEYTAIFHADDVYEPEMVAKQIAFLKAKPNAGAVFASANFIDGDGRKFGGRDLPRDLNGTNHLYDLKSIFKAVLLHSNFFICPSVMVRTKVYKEEIKRWRDELFGTSADLDVWFRILQRHDIGILPERLMRYRISANQGSELQRRRTLRPDIFRVIDYYLAQAEVQAFLTPEDWLHVGWLERTDRVVRAVNFYMVGDVREANALCQNLLTFDSIRAALQGWRGFVTLIAGLSLKFFILFHLSVIGRFIIFRLRRFSRK
jgi:glycosyltransferase involved in cell wall biosynthesis